MEPPPSDRTLSTARWAEMMALFDTLDALPEGERAARRDAHPDRTLAGGVGRMLEAAGDAPDRLQAVIAGSQTLVTELPVPETIGRYRVVGELGRGGMGTVYEAVSDDEYRVRVAIKVAALAGAGPLIEARFDQERRILAALDHQGIARFLDGGSVAGRPYFVMELVEGVPITTYCRDAELPAAGRVALIRQVLGAVHFAHEHLVVHRDLKPSNILVTAAGVPKLLDFGIAGMLDPGGGPAATLGLPTWTPDYASPEQATGRVVGIRSDVYSLGLVLHELLTGERAQTADTSSPLALSRSVCDVTPPLPSARAAVAGHHATARACRGDLDTVVMTAIDKDPGRRYGSAAEFSDDLDRALRGFPIKARPPRRLYRARRFVTRHAWGVAAAVVVAAVAVLGTIATAYQARRAERRFQDVRALANAFVFDVHDQVAQLPGSTNARKSIVTTALTYLERLRTDAGSDDALVRELASAYARIGSVQGHPLQANLGDTAGALDSYDRAVQLLTPLADRDDRRAALELARVDHLRAAVRRARGDRAGTDEAIQRARTRGMQLLSAGREGALLSLLGEIEADLARVAQADGNVSAAGEASERAMRFAEEGAALSPRDLSSRDNLATAVNALGTARLSEGRIVEAAGLFRRSAALREALVADAPDRLDLRRGLMVSYGNLGDVLGYRLGQNLGDVAGAVDALQKAAGLARSAMAADASDRRARFDVVNAELRIGGTLAEAGDRLTEARQHLDEADRLNRALLGEEPNSDRYGLAQIVIERRLGTVLARAGERSAALRRTDAALAIAQRLAAGPSAVGVSTQISLALAQKAAILAALADASAATTAALAAERLDRHPPTPALIEAETFASLAATYVVLAERSQSAQTRAAMAERATACLTSADHAVTDAVSASAPAPLIEHVRQQLALVQARLRALRQ